MEEIGKKGRELFFGVGDGDMVFGDCSTIKTHYTYRIDDDGRQHYCPHTEYHEIVQKPFVLDNPWMRYLSERRWYEADQIPYLAIMYAVHEDIKKLKNINGDT